MKKEDLDELSYTSLKELVELRNWVKSAEQANDDIIYHRTADSVLHEFLDKSDRFAYNIAFDKANEGAASNYYTVYFRPSGLTSNVGCRGQMNFEQIKKSFSEWLSYVKKMHEITQEYYNPNDRFYNEEFKDFFTNTDTDASISPFDLPRQEILYYFLSFAESQISLSDELAEEIKQEFNQDIANLKKEIPNLTKKETVKSLSKLAQKIKKQSNNLFHLVFDVLKKEFIKNALYKGLDYMPNAVETVKNWLALLT